MNEALGQQAAPQGTKVEVASVLAELLDDAVERWPRFNTHEFGEPADGTYVVRRKDIESPEAAQQYQRRAPRPDPRKLAQDSDSLLAAHA